MAAHSGLDEVGESCGWSFGQAIVDNLASLDVEGSGEAVTSEVRLVNFRNRVALHPLLVVGRVGSLILQVLLLDALCDFVSKDRSIIKVIAMVGLTVFSESDRPLKSAERRVMTSPKFLPGPEMLSCLMRSDT